MAAYWLTYKPLSPASPRGWPKIQMTSLVRHFEVDPVSATPLWRIASYRNARVGDRVYLFKQGLGTKGIFGVGRIIEEPRPQADRTDIDDGLRHRVKICFELLVDPDLTFLVDFETIRGIVPTSLIAAQASGYRVPDTVVLQLEQLLGSLFQLAKSIGNQQADDDAFDPDSSNDERERAIRSIRMRRGQSDFRIALLRAYDGRCAITGCDVADVLEAAHISPYSGPLSNQVSNGLLLRADIHTLFDCGVLGIDPEKRCIVVSDRLKNSCYGKLIGKLLRDPKEVICSPSRQNLESRYQYFKSLNKTI